ncbi:MAG: hypothetical protein AMXMBFR36_00310 [Acidobacteriota bacterium]
MKFANHERDGFETGFDLSDDLDYMHARFRSPLTGKFLSVDPVLGDPKMPQSWNRYTYAISNPLRNLDSTGRAAHDFSRGSTEDVKTAYRYQRALRELLKPEVKDYVQKQYGIDLEQALTPGGGTDDTRLVPLVGAVADYDNIGSTPWSDILRLNIDMDLFGNDGALFKAGLLHETIHWAADKAGFIFDKRGETPVEFQDAIDKMFKKYPQVMGHSQPPYVVELLQFGEPLTLTLTD